MNVVDSSGWLEYFADDANADFFAPAITDIPNLLVPSVSIYEVFKRVFQQRGENKALQAVAIMHQGLIVDLDIRIALNAARISLDMKLPMADSIIYATAKVYNATLWTQDFHFQAIKDVKYIAG